VSSSLIKAGLYTHMNMGAIHAQWIWRSLETTARGMSLWRAAFPRANSSQALDSMALEVRRVRMSDLEDSSAYVWMGER